MIIGRGREKKGGEVRVEIRVIVMNTAIICTVTMAKYFFLLVKPDRSKEGVIVTLQKQCIFLYIRVLLFLAVVGRDPASSSRYAWHA